MGFYAGGGGLPRTEQQPAGLIAPLLCRVEPTRVISTRDFEFLSASSIWCHPVISSDIWFPLCKGKIHASTNNNLKYPRFFDAFFLYSVFSVWTAQMEIGGMFRRDAGQNAPLLRHKTKGKSRIMNQNSIIKNYLWTILMCCLSKKQQLYSVSKARLPSSEESINIEFAAWKSDDLSWFRKNISSTIFWIAKLYSHYIT